MGVCLLLWPRRSYKPSLIVKSSSACLRELVSSINLFYPDNLYQFSYFHGNRRTFYRVRKEQYIHTNPILLIQKQRCLQVLCEQVLKRDIDRTIKLVMSLHFKVCERIMVVFHDDSLSRAFVGKVCLLALISAGLVLFQWFKSLPLLTSQKTID